MKRCHSPDGRRTAYKLQFQITHRYGAAGGIVLPVELGSGTERVRLDANLDTGAEFCLFENAYATVLGLDTHLGARNLLHR